MGQATRTTKLSLALNKREQGGANPGKRAVPGCDRRGAHPGAGLLSRLFPRPCRETRRTRAVLLGKASGNAGSGEISANELLTWAEACTVETQDHPHPWPGWNFTEAVPRYALCVPAAVVIKDAIGKVRSYLSNLAHWEKSRGKKEGQTGPTWSQGSPHPPTRAPGAPWKGPKASRDPFCSAQGLRWAAVWQWVNYPVKCSRYFEQRRRDPAWEYKAPSSSFATGSCGCTSRRPKR